MADSLRVTHRVLVPAAAIQVRAVRASGPGGQNVNKVASKVEFTVNLELIEGLSEAERMRLGLLTAKRRDAEGRLRVTSQRTRDQHRNLADCRHRVRELIERSLRAPRQRRETRPTGAARQRRLAEKRQRSERKQNRRRLGSEDA
jgi:ribosome-associated protein